MRKRTAKPTAPGAPLWRLGAPVGRPVDFAVRFRIAVAGRALRIHAPGVGFGGLGELFQVKM